MHLAGTSSLRENMGLRKFFLWSGLPPTERNAINVWSGQPPRVSMSTYFLAISESIKRYASIILSTLDYEKIYTQANGQ